MSGHRSLWFQLLSCAAIAGSVFVLSFVAASAATADRTRLGLRGLKRQRALENLPAWSALEPLVRWLGARFSGLVSPNFREQANRKLSLAGDYLGLLPEEALGIMSKQKLIQTDKDVLDTRYFGSEQEASAWLKSVL